tara:strand:+ start:3039 stop:3455 length:417 start_codon:yes stop_codon:yes gene_type:complete
MKKSELKGIIKECVKEILFEEGVLSNLVAEVAFGITRAQNQILETQSFNSTKQSQKAAQENKKEIEEAQRKKLLETKRKMLNAIGGANMQGVFEGTEPLRGEASSNPHSPMSGLDPQDAGVDISGLFGLAGKKWKQLK